MFRHTLRFFVIAILLVSCQPPPTEAPTPSPTPEAPPILYDLSITVDPPGAGFAYPSSGQYEAGEELNFRTRPDDGYIFSHWSGDISGDSSRATLILDANKSVTAHFTRVSMLKTFELDEDSYAPNHVSNILLTFTKVG